MTRILNSFLILLIALLLNIDQGFGQQTFKKGDTILIPVPIGTDDSILGGYFNSDLNKVSDLKKN